MSDFDKFQLRKDVFDYLRLNLPLVDVVPEHPTGTAATKPKVVVSLIRDAATSQGYLADQKISNPEIQITCYAVKELELTKPNGLLKQIETLMQAFQINSEQPNNHKVRDTYIGFVQDYLLYCNYVIYRFYGGNI